MKDFYKDYSPKSPVFPETRPLQLPTRRFIPSPLERIFLEDLIQHPFEGADKRAKKLGLIPRDATRIQKTLVENGVITPVTVERKKLFEVTPSGAETLSKIGIKVVRDGHQGLEHRYFVEQVRQDFLQNGWFTFKEKNDIDLVLEKDDRVIAMEFETGKNNPDQTRKNIKKLIQFHLADERCIIATNPIALQKSKALLADSTFPDKDSIRISLARDLSKILSSPSYSHPE